MIDRLTAILSLLLCNSYFLFYLPIVNTVYLTKLFTKKHGIFNFALISSRNYSLTGFIWIVIFNLK